MKPISFFVIAAGLAVAPLLSTAPSSAQYQEGIREATEHWRGDDMSNQVVTKITYYRIDPLWLRERSAGVPHLFVPAAFASISFSMKEDLAILLSPAPDQALQLTTTAPRPEKLFDDLLPSTAIDTRHR